jgi:hypothetical protein
MAKDVITRFKLETTQYDSKLKTAARELADFGKTAKSSGRDFNEFTRKQVEAARGIGSMATATTNAKQKTKELVGAFNDLARSYNQLTDAQKQSNFGKAMSQSLTQLQQRIHQTKQEMQGVGNASGGGLFGGGMSGMLQVFGGNLMTKAAGWAADFASEMGQAVQQGIELARQGEGIRNAFERLGRGDILNGLREATHGTVTDLELMKAAVKFNDFNLPLEELGTMLAFAQQKAKDTGQSVDYMVESITNGLGRQSKPILDNLGISAKEIEERMKSTGDFTKAVGEIVREQMTKAGDYIETAADRATKADVDLKNAMEELGRTLMPLEEQGVSMWTSLKTGAIELLNDGVKPLVPVIVDLKGEISDLYTTVSNSSVFNGLVNYMKASWEWCSNLIPVVRNLRKLMQGNDLAGGAGVAGVLGDVMSYNGGQLPNVTVTPPRISGGGKTVKGGARSSVATKVEEILPVGSVAALNKELSDLRKQQELATDTAGWRAQQREIDALTTKIKILKGEMPDPNNIQSAANGASFSSNPTAAIPENINIDTGYIDNLVKKGKEMENAYKLAASAVSSIGEAFANIEDPSAKAAGTVMQAIASIALGFATASAQANTAGTGWGWLAWVAAGAAAMATTISTIHSLTGFEHGGEIKGNSFSGDNTPIMANAGEVVLTRAMAGNIASQLQGSGNNVHVTGELRGESIFLAVNRSLKRRGKGELVTWG